MNPSRLACLICLSLAALTARADTFFVVGSGNNTIQHFASDGTDLGAFTSANLSVPTASAISPSGKIFVTEDQFSGSIEYFDPDGTDLGTFAAARFGNAHLTRTYGLVFDAAGNLYAANFGDGTIEKFDADGSDLGAFATGVSGPVGMAFDRSGNLYVANYSNNSVTRYSSAGASLGVFATGGLATPYAIAFDDGGSLYVSNIGTNTVRKFSPAGADLGTFATTGNGPTGIVFDQAGNLYVANEQDHNVQKFSPTGASLGVFATAPVGSSPASIVRLAGGGGDVVQFTTSSFGVNESSGTANVAVKRTGGGAGQVSVHYATSDATAAAGTDYTATAGDLTWADGDLTDKVVSVPILDRGLADANVVTFTVSLSSPSSGAALGTTSQAVVLISENDTATATTVTVASPPAGLTITAGTVLPLAVSVFDPVGRLARVQFLIDGERAASIPAPGPYSTSVTAPTTAGPHTLTVTGASASGAVIYRSMLDFNVVAADPATPAPTAAILADLTGRLFVAGSSLPVTVTAASGTAGVPLTRVDFYADGVLFASLDGSGNPITSAHSGLPVVKDDPQPVGNGTTFTANFTLPGATKLVNILAVALDKLGRSQISPPAAVQSIADTADKPPVVDFNGLTDGQRIGIGFPLNIAVSAVDPDSLQTPLAFHGPRPRAFDVSPLIQKVEYYLNSIKAKEEAAAPFALGLTAPAEGTYVVTVIATDGAGLATVSKPLRLQAVTPVTVTLAAKGTGVTAEGGGKLKALFSRSGDASADLTVLYKATGVAQNKKDYLGTDGLALSGSAVIPAGTASLKLKIVPKADTKVEGTEAFKLKLLPSLTGEYVIGAPAKAKFSIADRP